MMWRSNQDGTPLIGRRLTVQWTRKDVWAPAAADPPEGRVRQPYAEAAPVRTSERVDFTS
jgi:hypothetical protein